ncbi:MAG: CBS domain-containing protein [Chloroflexi bacterium]|nr:CBS domain-containing protein [Chloroflexota bacterium]
MRKDPCANSTPSVETPLHAALRLLTDGGFRHLPIVRQGHPVGVLTSRDVLRHRARRSLPALHRIAAVDRSHHAAAGSGRVFQREFLDAGLHRLHHLHCRHVVGERQFRRRRQGDPEAEQLQKRTTRAIGNALVQPHEPRFPHLAVGADGARHAGDVSLD